MSDAIKYHKVEIRPDPNRPLVSHAIEVFIDGKKLEGVRGFELKAHVDQPHVVTMHLELIAEVSFDGQAVLSGDLEAKENK